MPLLCIVIEKDIGDGRETERRGERTKERKREKKKWKMETTH
jgi:hypothetical protein